MLSPAYSCGLNLRKGAAYSGWAPFETDFDKADPGKDIEWGLDLGAVRETREALMNDIPLGAGAAREGIRRWNVEKPTSKAGIT